VSNTHNNYPIPDAKRPVGRIGTTEAADEGWDDFTPLTPEQALRLREKQPPVSPWRVLVWQALVGLAVSLLTWLATGKGNVAASALYGAVAVVVPGAVFARGLSSRCLLYTSPSPRD
jgi:ATP synthase protein I